MNRRYKQWKKVLATSWFLAAYAIGMFVFAFLAVNFVLNMIVRLPSYWHATLQTAADQATHRPSFFEGCAAWLITPISSFLPVYVIVAIILAILLPIRLYKMRIAYRDINLGTEGTRRWTTLKEIKEQYTSIADDDKEYPGKSGYPVLHYEHRLYIETMNTHSVLDSSTQSGKTESFTYPFLDALMRAEIKDSVFITDIKGDILKNTRAEFVAHGYDVKVFNLLLPYQGIAYNPLELVRKAYMKGDYAKAQMLCNTLSYSLFHNPNAKDPMWEESSISLTNALILAVCGICKKIGHPECITMYTVTVMLNELGSNPDEDGMTDLDNFFSSLPVNDPAKLQYGTVQFSQGVTRSGIFTGTMAKLKNYAYDTIARMTSANDLNFEDMAYGEKPVALFIVYPDWDDSNYSLISTFLSQANAVLSEKATLSKDSCLPRRIHYVLEEAANIPAIEGLSRAMNVGLSRNILYHLVIQSRAQLEDKYGKELAAAIIGACGNRYFIMSDGEEDAEEFSKLLGTQTVVAPDRQGDPLAIDKVYSEREAPRPLLMPDELMTLQDGEWVLIRTKHRRNLKGRRIKPYPVFANVANGTQMLARHEYLMHRFNHPSTFEEMDLWGAHKDIDLNKLVIDFQHPEAVAEPSSAPVAEDHSKTKEGDPLENRNIEGIPGTETGILTVLTGDQLELLRRSFARLDPDRAETFNRLDTVEAVEQFFGYEANAALRKADGIRQILSLLPERKEA
ncbi:type IV secretory system conjugative DNA transfer family protein [Sporolactobacillus shoreae]|uniref:Type IV secretory system conjugative DNA transfer family protein n=1 Tax=Sporolactobacillus shoreae TaxID=1465501 RepID=A0A4Z0GPK5_9BACL|nr:type IV secretory system conjugative DNA transfer family protein [Sporolactobacillus shoreae]TGA98606.1 type IV secretory system conjugative DNA transfer family protein [Sporolactobacillus shoreae]